MPQAIPSANNGSGYGSKKQVQEVETRYGRLQVVDPENDLISRFLATYGEWGSCETRFVAANLADGAAVADIGAFLGTFGLGVAGLRPLRALCCVEANSSTFPLLHHNIAANKPASLEAAVALGAIVGPAGDLPGEASMIPGNAGSFSLATAADDNRVAIPVAAHHMTLAALRQEHGPFDLIKIDVEGLELAILRDDQEFLETCDTTFWLECNEVPGSLDLAEFLLDRGFSLFYFAFPATTADNFKKAEPVDFPYGYEAGLWATRGTAPVMSDNLRVAGCILKPVKSREDLRLALWMTPHWAPATWVGRSHQETVALAAHSLLGERLEDYLVAFVPDGSSRPWSPPLPITLQQQIDDQKIQIQALDTDLILEREKTSALAEQCATVKAHLENTLKEARAQKILLVQEREQAATYATTVTKQLDDLAKEARASKVMLAQERDRATHVIQSQASQLEHLHAQLNDTLSERERIVTHANNLTAINEGLTLEKDALLQERERIVTHANNLTAINEGLALEKDALLQERERIATHANNLTAIHEGLALEKDALLQERERIATHARNLTAINEGLALEKDALLQERERIITHADNLAATLDELTREGQALRREKEQLRLEAAALQQREANLTHQVQTLSGQVAGMYHSTSWRVTLPIRLLSRLLRGDFKELKRLYARKRGMSSRPIL
ncbi:FkbM family methyltransferase [Nitrospirillum sp. BR 11164]|uniref:FkbM family methyltransferase n=1 Tax=Nitrospirillum sp. BR 11164 TaxID=3104324 RepID=UPI002AFEFECB|nr:FkbM family methyltransferase [Nitrospirillum sp. BR 11164]MEA1647531.1 FkbM family methyltransferase [Nitrospirillum sp. BR 11164]